MLTATKAFTDAVRAGDVEAAKAAYADSRYHWETIEPIAGLVSDVDGAVDSRVDDFASVDDPAFTGWHRLEYILWETGRSTPSRADRRPSSTRTLLPLPQLIEGLEMTPKDVALGAAGLIEEVCEGKITARRTGTRTPTSTTSPPTSTGASVPSRPTSRSSSRSTSRSS